MNRIVTNLITKLFPPLILNFFITGQKRSIKAKKNIVASFALRGISILITLLLLPLTINYVSPAQYGIWITISSIVGWFGVFDIGLSHGLRNKFAEARAKGDDELAGIYVSTTFAILGIICFILWIISLSVIPFLNWSEIVNTDQELNTEIAGVVIIVFSYFCMQFVLSIINTVLVADQKPALVSFIEISGNFVSLISIIIIREITDGSLIKLGLALCLSPLAVIVGANFFFFNGVYKKYRPRISKVCFKYSKSLFNIGIMFFIIQIAGIIQFQTANIIIAQSYNTQEVTSYNIVYRYFGVITMVFNIFLTPFWSASTEAYVQKDFNWIKNSIRKYNYLNVLMLIMGLLMLILSGAAYDLWIGKENVDISFELSFWAFLFFSASMFGGKYCSFLNGISALRIQFIASVISPFVYAGSALMLIKVFNLGPYSLFIASILANFNGFILAPIQYHMVINKNKKGIWLK